MFYQKKNLLKKLLQHRFEYSPLGKELKAQTDTEKKQYQTLDKIYETDEKKAIKENK